jgi:hypothetical protein
MDYLIGFCIYFVVGVIVNGFVVLKSVKDGSVTVLTIECLWWSALASLAWPAIITYYAVKRFSKG